MPSLLTYPPYPSTPYTILGESHGSSPRSTPWPPTLAPWSSCVRHPIFRNHYTNRYHLQHYIFMQRERYRLPARACPRCACAHRASTSSLVHIALDVCEPPLPSPPALTLWVQVWLSHVAIRTTDRRTLAAGIRTLRSHRHRPRISACPACGFITADPSFHLGDGLRAIGDPAIDLTSRRHSRWPGRTRGMGWKALAPLPSPDAPPSHAHGVYAFCARRSHSLDHRLSAPRRALDARRLSIDPICAESALNGQSGLCTLAHYRGCLKQHESPDQKLPQPNMHLPTPTVDGSRPLGWLARG